MADAAKDNVNESLGSKILVGLAIAVLTALFGYLMSYLDQHRKDQVAFVSTQIEKLYGPLFALVQANNTAWSHFRQSYWNDRDDYFQKGVRLGPEEVELWRRWMRNVFQPMNIKMEAALVDNAQLLVGDRMPPMFLQFISHVEAYKSVIANWKDGAASKPEDASAIENASPVAFPKQPDFSNCIVQQFHSLKALQQRLQGQFIGGFQSLKEEIPKSCGL